MRELDVVGVRVEMPSSQPIVLLRERDGDRYLPIWIGAAEATAIAYAQQGVVPPRPLTHDLFKDVLEALNRTLQEVRIVALRDGVFYADLVFDGAVQVSARSSDAIALALRAKAPIFINDGLLNGEGGDDEIDEDDDEEEAEADPGDAPRAAKRASAEPSDEEIAEELRRRLSEMNPEDFGKFQL